MFPSEAVRVNGVEVWSFAVETDSGLRVRFGLDEWDALRLYRGQRVTVQRPGRPSQPLFVASVLEVPPLAWVEFAAKLTAPRRLAAG